MNEWCVGYVCDQCSDCDTIVPKSPFAPSRVYGISNLIPKYSAIRVHTAALMHIHQAANKFNNNSLCKTAIRTAELKREAKNKKCPKPEKTTLHYTSNAPHAHHPPPDFFVSNMLNGNIIFFYSRPNGLKSEQIGRPPSRYSMSRAKPFRHFMINISPYIYAIFYRCFEWSKMA